MRCSTIVRVEVPWILHTRCWDKRNVLAVLLDRLQWPRLEAVWRWCPHFCKGNEEGWRQALLVLIPAHGGISEKMPPPLEEGSHRGGTQGWDFIFTNKLIHKRSGQHCLLQSGHFSRLKYSGHIFLTLLTFSHVFGSSCLYVAPSNQFPYFTLGFPFESQLNHLCYSSGLAPNKWVSLGLYITST